MYASCILLIFLLNKAVKGEPKRQCVDDPCSGNQCKCRLLLSDKLKMTCPRLSPAHLRGMDQCYSEYEIDLELNGNGLVLPSETLSKPGYNPLRKIDLSAAKLSCDCKNAWLANLESLERSSYVEMRNASQPCHQCAQMTPRILLSLPKFSNISKTLRCYDAVGKDRSLADFTQANCGSKGTLEIVQARSTVECKIFGAKNSNVSERDCIQFKISPFFHKEKLEIVHANCSYVIFDISEGQNVLKSGWLKCSRRNEPEVKVTRILLNGKPVFLEQKFSKLGRNVGINTTLVSSRKLKITWGYLREISKRTSQLWEILPNSGGRFFVAEVQPTISDGFMAYRYVTKIMDPNIKCTGGLYFMRACNDFGCSAANFTVDSSSPPCARLNSTFYGRVRKTFHEPGGENIEIEEPMNIFIPDPKIGQEKHRFNETLSKHFNVIVCVLGLSVIILLVICILTARHISKNNVARHSSLGLSGYRDSRDGDGMNMTMNSAYTSWLMLLAKNSTIALLPSKEIEVTRQLGEGAFGIVYLVEYTPTQEPPTPSSKYKMKIRPPMKNSKHYEYINGKRCLLPKEGAATGTIQLAMKTLKYFSRHRLQDLEREAALLTQMSHPNIVKFFGLTFRPNEGFALLFEYMEYGDLVHYLRDHNPDLNRHLSSEDILMTADLVQICIQVAAGLEYLADNHMVHRDLAARNCLVGRNRVVKLSDFGMTRDLYISDYYKMDEHTMVPLRWLPPESLLYRKFTSESDMWSFGVLIWEVFSFGQVPWCGHSNYEVLDLVKEGKILEKPKDFPDKLYSNLFLKCCAVKPEERFSAKNAKEILHNYLNVDQTMEEPHVS